MREVTWTRIGTDVSGTTTIDQLLTEAGLNYTVHKEPIFLANGTEIKGKVSTVQLITDAAAYMNGFTNTAEELAQLRVTDTDRYAIMDAFFDSTREISERQKAMIEEQRAFFNRCYEADDNGNFRGTAWGMLNAFTDFTTHKEVKNTAHADESKFMNVTFDTSAMNKFLELVRERVG